MRNRIRREIALLCLPVLLIAGVGLLVQAELRPKPVNALQISRRTGAEFPYNGVQVDLLLEWKPSFLDRRAEYPMRAKCWVLDADGKLVAKQNGYEFGRARIAIDETVPNQWLLHPNLDNLDPTVRALKEPLTLQGTAIIGNSAPLNFSLCLPEATARETPRVSKFGFRRGVAAQVSPDAELE